MNKFFTLLMITAVCGFPAYGEVPPSPSFDKDYRVLLSNSPFGKKAPPVVEQPVQAPPTTTYALKGLSETSYGWNVSLVDKKDPTKRISIRTGAESENGISLEKVELGQGDYRDTKVVIKQGGTRFTVGFDKASLEKSIAATVAQNKQAAQQAPNRNASANPSQPNSQPDQNPEYQKQRQEIMKEAAELRKMRESGNTGEAYQKRRQALMDKTNEMRRQWRSRRSGNDSNGRTRR